MEFKINKYGILFLGFPWIVPFLFFSFLFENSLFSLQYSENLLVIEFALLTLLFVFGPFFIIFKDEVCDCKELEVCKIIKNSKEEKIEIILELDLNLNLFLDYNIDFTEIFLGFYNSHCQKTPPNKIIFDDFQTIKENEIKIIKKSGSYKIKLIFDFCKKEKDFSDVLTSLHLNSCFKRIDFESGQKELEVLDKNLYKYKNGYFLALKLDVKLNNSKLKLFNAFGEEKNEIVTDSVYSKTDKGKKIKGFYGLNINPKHNIRKQLMKLNNIYNSIDEKKALIYKDGEYNIVYFLGEFEDDISYINFKNKDIGEFEFDLDKGEYLDLEEKERG